MIDAALQRIWYGRSAIRWVAVILLLPLTFLFVLATAVRKICYRAGVLRTERVSRPVIVVGNITVGGTGKTPFVIWLCDALRSAGQIPGIITRGYGGSSTVWPRDVQPADNPAQLGDESVLLAQRTGAIVVAGPDRVASARRAIERGATVVICDDGLQHYRLARDFEIAVVDSSRGFGNAFRMPSGPLREAVSRLKSVDVVMQNDREAKENKRTALIPSSALSMRARIDSVRSLSTGEERSLSSFSGRRVHAVAGIGNPQAFFASLERAGLIVAGRALADHARILRRDLEFGDDDPVLMTEKDAVKCRGFADLHLWSVPLKVEIDRPAVLMNAIGAVLTGNVDPNTLPAS